MNRIKGNLLYVSDEGRGLLFDQQTFFWVELKSGNRHTIMSVLPTGMKGLMSRNRLASRLMRLEPRCVELLDEGRFVVCHTHKIWLLDVNRKSFSVVQESREGFSNPLNLCSVGKYVYWGDYGDNAKRETVNIYRLDKNLNTTIVFSFPKGEIRHIHNIVWDEKNLRFFILTGDLEEKSGIYIADADWRKVEPVVTGKQQYRAVAAFPYEDGLVYATDSVEENNNIYLLRGKEVKTLAAFPGSCIYGVETKDYYVFSSTVEPPEGRGILKMFSYKLGPGIKDRYAHLKKVRKTDLKVEEVMKFKKDIWPMKLFQYGSILFPKGQKENNDLWYYLMACKGDGKFSMVTL